MARLIGRTGAVSGQDFVLSDNMRLGAAAESDIRIAVEGVSRRHARVFREGDHYWLEDTGATNGTFLNGARIQRESLRHLDVVTLGRAVDLIFLSREDEPPPAPEVDQLSDVKVEILDGPEAGTVIDVPRGEITLGRAPSCNVVLNSPAVGRAHARIERSARRLLVQDLQSANGTSVNGKPIDGAMVLSSGDVISLAGVRSVSVRFTGRSAADIAVPMADSRPMNQEWKTRFVWGPEELAQIEALRADAIARAKLVDLGGAKAAAKRPPPAPAKPAAAAAPAAKPAAPPAPGAPAAKPAAPAAPAAKPAAPPTPGAPAAKPAAPPAPGAPAAKPAAPAAPAAKPAAPPAPAAKPAAPATPPTSAPTAAPSAAKPPVQPPAQARAESPAVSNELTIKVPPASPRIQGVRLLGPGGPVRFGLGTFRIGRAVDADLRLEDRQASRNHAVLVVDATSVAIEDLKTVNGTLLNGREVKGREPLKAGDVLRFGEAEFTIELT